MSSVKLPTARLGNTSLIVTRPSLGCMTIGDTDEHVNRFGAKVADKNESFRILDEYYNKGGNFLDTANLYDNGGSERVIGLWLKKKRDVDNIVDIRDRIVVATKCYFSLSGVTNNTGLGRGAILNAINESLARLQTNYVDLYIAHSYDELAPLDEVLRTFNQLITEGKVRHWGVSNWPAVRIVQAVERCRANGWVPPCSAQMQYSLLCRNIEVDYIDICIEYGIAITAWSPLAMGWLTGRVSRTNIDSERAASYKKSGFLADEEKAYTVIEKLNEVSRSINKKPTHVSLRFLIDYNPKLQVIPIIGSNNVDHVVDALESESFRLGQEQIDAINEVSKIPVTYPNSMIAFTRIKKVDDKY